MKVSPKRPKKPGDSRSKSFMIMSNYKRISSMIHFSVDIRNTKETLHDDKKASFLQVLDKLKLNESPQ